MEKLLIATSNPDKLTEIAETLRGVPFELRTLADFPAIVPPDETGRTFAENARQKALYYAAATNALTLAEDSGLEIDALMGAPGVESARYGGQGISYPDRFATIYSALRSRGALGSPARFVCAVAVVKGGRVILEAEGVVEGRIADEPKGEGGFGYDPIFFYPPFGLTLAEAGSRKSEVSHRGKAVRQVRTFLMAFSPAAPAPREA